MSDYIPELEAPWHDEAIGYYHGNVRKLLLQKVDIAREPGKDFQYCNYNASYSGLIIERATGKSVHAKQADCQGY
jgi:CubicO group peptidase (beta-lactamase class C family)